MTWAPDYATKQELANYLRIPDMGDDVTLGLAVSAASRSVDYTANRQFGATDTVEVRQYVAHPDYTSGDWTVSIDDITDTTGLVVQVDDSDVDTYTLTPRNATSVGTAYTTLHFSYSGYISSLLTVSITGTWGWTEVPTAVKNATLLQASRLWKRKDAPFGVAGSPDQGSELRLLAKIDPDVEVMLRPYKRPRSVY